MSENTYIIAGLGNPGEKYSETRHNIGFQIVDTFARRCRCSISNEKWNATSAVVSMYGHTVHLVKPMTFMNLSGRGIFRFVGFYKVSPERLIVVHDDLDMKTGRLKLVAGGGAGGHNGIRSTIEALGSKDFFRLKLGIGRPVMLENANALPVEKYVLTAFDKQEGDLVRERIEIAVDGLEIFLKDGPSRAMNFLNGFK